MPGQTRAVLALVVLLTMTIVFGGTVLAQTHSPQVKGLGVDQAKASQAGQAAARKAKAAKVAFLKKGIGFNRQATWHWQDVALVPHAQTRYRERGMADINYLSWANQLWARRAKAAWRHAIHPPHIAAWLCIHDGYLHANHPPYRVIGDVYGTGEAAWDDSGDPYWGGLQMDQGFMTRYASKQLLKRGWANRWSPLEQMWVAENAFRHGRGFYPWPHTAHWCGLIS